MKKINLKGVFTRNDIWRYIGLAMIIGGQFADKETFVIAGNNIPTNLIQITGFVLMFLPHILRMFGNKKESNTDLPPQA
jgi:hypothetical protein